MGFSTNIWIQTAWGILLNQYFGNSDVVFGLVRSYPSSFTEGCRGSFYHTFPVRIKQPPEVTVLTLLHTVKQQNNVAHVGFVFN